jgi:hypothetical protein
MKAIRAVTDAPKPRDSLIGRLIALPGRLIDGASAAFAEWRAEPETARRRSDEDLWLLLVASDPDGIWYPWHANERRPERGDAADSA